MTDSQGLMNIGKHCDFCRNIDFLPFLCDECGLTFCGEHRRDHNCKGGLKKEEKKQSKTSSGKVGPTAASLFEEAKMPKSYQLDKQKTNSVAKVLGTSAAGTLALNKVKKFIASQKKLAGKLTSLTFKSVFGAKTNPSQRIVQIHKLKEAAKGDPKVPVSERVYVWVTLVPDDSEKVVEDQPHPLFISRTWPVGRALDFAAAHLKIKNNNNKVTDKKLKLQIYINRANTLTVVPAGGRVNKEFSDGDKLYLVRGEL